MKKFSLILNFLKPYKKQLILVFLLSLIHIITGFFLVGISKKGGQYLPVIFFSTIGISVVLTFFEDYLIHPVGVSISKTFLQRNFSNILSLPRDKISVKLLNKTVEESRWMSDGIFSLIRTVLRRFLQLFAFSFHLLIINYKLFFLTLILIPFAIIPGWYIGKIVTGLREKLFVVESEFEQFQVESVLNNEIIKAYENKSFILEHQHSYLEKISKLNLKQKRLYSIISPVSLFSLVLVGLFVYLLGTHLITNKEITFSTLGMFFTGLALLYSPVSGFSYDLTLLNYLYTKPIMENIKEIEELKLNYVDDFNNDIVIDNLSFYYDKQKPVLENFSMKITKGETIGICGENGSGKTSLIYLILGILKPKTGSIRIDGENSYLNPEFIGYMDQDGSVFTKDIQFNTAFGREVENEKILELCRKLNLNFEDSGKVISFKSLSGGQRRKIALVRTLLKNPKLLVLDEPEDSLDEKSINSLIKLIKTKQNESVTMLILSHDSRFLDLCDKIIKMEIN
jgi:ABC-type bacteriocin/lantibiotic exporter with double-glycine peptidase domain